MLRTCLLVAVIAFVGCNRQPKNLEPAPLDAAFAASQAMETLDADQDGQIGKSELKASPGLQAALRKTDTNGDGALTEQEIAERLQHLVDSKAALRNFQLSITLNRQPAPGLSVTLIPEQFLTPAIEPAVGDTNHLGIAYPTVEFEDPAIVKQGIAGVRPGMYRVSVSKLNADGKETIPSRYNTDTQLGVNVDMDDHAMPPTLNISVR